MKSSKQKVVNKAISLSLALGSITPAFAFSWFSQDDRPEPDEAMISTMRHPIAQGVRVKIAITHYRNSISCVGQWTDLNRFNRAFAMDSQTLLNRDSEDNRFQLLAIAELGHEDRHSLARGRRFPDTMISDGENWNTFLRQDVTVSPLVSLRETEGQLSIETQAPEWVALQMNEPRRTGAGLVMEFETPVAIDALGRVRIELGTANRGPYTEGRTTFNQVARTLLGTVDVAYDLTHATPATETRMGGVVTTAFTGQTGSPNPCLQGWVQIAAQHTR